MARATLNGISLYYEIHGEGRPLVLLHGADGTLSSWAKQIRAFSACCRVIVYDNRGFGRSDAPERGYSPQHYADDLRLLLVDLGIDKTLLLGYSMGGLTALLFALEHPEMVNGLILVGTGSREIAVDDAWRQSRLEALDLANAEGMAAVFDRTMRVFSTKFVRTHPEEVARYRSSFAETPPESFGRRTRAMLSDSDRRVDATPRLVELEVPTLLIFGEKDPALPNALVLQSTIPEASFVSLPGAGHACHFEQPEIFNTKVLEFLSNLGRAADQSFVGRYPM